MACWKNYSGACSRSSELGEKRETLEAIYNRARGRLKRYTKHRSEPFTPAYQGKWISVADSKRLKSFSGVPQNAQRTRMVASIECFEEIPCRACQSACPEEAIHIGRVPSPVDLSILTEDKCTACGICVSACPSRAIVMMQEEPEKSVSRVSFFLGEGLDRGAWVSLRRCSIGAVRPLDLRA